MIILPVRQSLFACLCGYFSLFVNEGSVWFVLVYSDVLVRSFYITCRRVTNRWALNWPLVQLNLWVLVLFLLFQWTFKPEFLNKYSSVRIIVNWLSHFSFWIWKSAACLCRTLGCPLFWNLIYFLQKWYLIFWLISDDQLCDSGSEAMFADLCYFSVRSVQVSSCSFCPFVSTATLFRNVLFSHKGI